MSATQTPTARQAPPWSTGAIQGLLETRTCPVCGSRDFADGVCRRCGADCSGPAGAQLWNASQAAVEALTRRQEFLERIPRVGESPAAEVVDPAAGPASSAPPPAPPAPADAGPPSSAEPRSSATVQSVLAVAGAGLVAIAAIVFTFLNPDLTDRTVGSLIVGAVTVVFFVGARALARRRLRFSAEAVGALGLVFLALDVYAFSDLAPAVSPWFMAALGTLIAASGGLVLAVLVRLRVWLWTSLAALALVPALAGAAGTGMSGALGWTASAVAAFVLIALVRAVVGPRFGAPARPEQWTLTVLQFAAMGVAFVLGLAATVDAPLSQWLLLAAQLTVLAVLAAVSTRHPARGLWSFAAGAAGTAAFVVAVPSLDGWVDPLWQVALAPVAAVAGLLVWAGVLRLPASVDRTMLTGGSVVAVAIGLAPAGMLAISILVLGLTPADTEISPWPGEPAASFAPSIGLAAAAAGLWAYAALPARPLRWLGDAGTWLAVAAGLTLVSVPTVVVPARIGLALLLVLGVSLVLTRGRRMRRPGIRVPLVLGTHAAIVLAAAHSWQDRTLIVPAGIALLAATAVVATTVPARWRFLHVGAGYAYALVVLATGLTLAGVDPVATLCLTTSAGAVVAVVTTFARRVGIAEWYAVLVVTSVPFAVGVAQVIGERNGWTALSTGLIFLLALTLVMTERPGLGREVRAAAAALLVPSLAVVVVCLGAQLLESSGSPVVLPVIAAIVALVLGSLSVVGGALARRIGDTDAALARLAVEASTLLTGAIALGLSFAREAAGLGTATLVLVILGLGAAAAALWAKRRYGWWLAGAAFTGALWCVWAMTGVVDPEPYLLPPALGAAAVGLVLAIRGAAGLPLYATGLAVAVVPLLAVQAAVGDATRGYLLVAASWGLVVVAGVLGRGAVRDRLAPLRRATYAVAIAASGASVILAARFGLGLDPAPTTPVVVGCLLVGVAGAFPAALAARGIRAGAPAEGRLRRTRWLFAPAALVLAASAWPGIHRDWATIWTLWALMLAFLVAVVAVAARQRSRRTAMPPALFLFAIAFTTAIVAWSPRDLRVEWFSLPLGVFLLAAGALHLRAGARVPGTLASWPAGFSGSWPLLAPGLVVALSASVAATFTDPQTWRAILVIGLALVAILVGAGAKLAAAFLIGIVVLPVENVLVFLVQIGRGIESMPWWITLAVVGAVLLILAVTYERREGADAGIAARLRDLR